MKHLGGMLIEDDPWSSVFWQVSLDSMLRGHPARGTLQVGPLEFYSWGLVTSSKDSQIRREDIFRFE